MYCKKCLGTINAEERFCTSCGTPIEGREAEVTIDESEVIEKNNDKGKESSVNIEINKGEVKTPMIQLDPKTGKSIMPDKVEHITKEESHSETIMTKSVPLIKSQPQQPLQENHLVQPVGQPQNILKTGNNNVYKKAPINQNPKPFIKVVDKTGEFILGIIAVVLSFISSLFGALFFVSIIAVNIFGMETTSIDASGDNFVSVLFAIIGLKGFVFATLGLIGVMNVKKNSTVAGLFFMSAAVGSLFSFQLIRGGLFLGAAIMCLTRHEKTEKPILNYIIGAFAPTIIVGIFVIILFFIIGRAEMDDTFEELNSVHVISQEMT